MTMDLKSPEPIDVGRRRESLVLGQQPGGVFALLLVIIGVILWVIGLTEFEPEQLSDFGLVSALSGPIFEGAVLVLMAFVVSITVGRHPTWLLAVETGVILLMLFGTGPLVEPELSNHVAWRHIGIAAHIVDSGIDSTIDAYFSWPGFFAGVAVIVDIVGTAVVVAASRWTPVVLNALYIVPIGVLANHVTGSRRATWTAIWFFLLGNWVGQDYFSPQGFAYFAFLGIAVLLIVYVADREPRIVRQMGRSADPVRVAALAAILGTFAWLVVSHQLTPFAVLAFTTVLAVVRRRVPYALPLAMALMLIAWLTLFAGDYLRGNLKDLAEQFGRFGELAEAGVVDRLRGSPEHTIVVRARLAASAVMGLLGLAGWIVAWRSSTDPDTRARYVSVGLFGCSPIVLLPAASYGGEMILRVYLFMLPVLAIYAAMLVMKPRRRLARGVVMFVVLGGFLAVFPITRYGNEQIVYFTSSEVEAVEVMYEHAPDGALLLSMTGNVPWKYQGYATYTYRAVSDSNPRPTTAELAHSIGTAFKSWDGEAYLIITTSQESFSRIFGIWEPGALPSLADALVEESGYFVVFRSDDAIVLRYVR